MNNRILTSLFLVQVALVSQQHAYATEIRNLELRDPVDAQTGTTTITSTKTEPAMGGLSAPGADAIMTPNMLLVSPKAADAQSNQPLKAFIGSYLRLQVDRYDIKFDRLQGVLVTVVNETNRPLVVNGNKGEAVMGGKTITACPVTTLQTIIVPPKNAEKIFEEILTKIAPAYATVGAIPTAKDFANMNKPILQRYGADEMRRRVEASRFGRRILWPQEKSTAVLYFDTEENVENCRIQIPANTLYDQQDKTELVSTSGNSLPADTTTLTPADTTISAPPNTTNSSPPLR